MHVVSLKLEECGHSALLSVLSGWLFPQLFLLLHSPIPVIYTQAQELLIIGGMCLLCTALSELRWSFPHPADVSSSLVISSKLNAAHESLASVCLIWEY